MINAINRTFLHSTINNSLVITSETTNQKYLKVTRSISIINALMLLAPIAAAILTKFKKSRTIEKLEVAMVLFTVLLAISNIVEAFLGDNRNKAVLRMALASFVSVVLLSILSAIKNSKMDVFAFDDNNDYSTARIIIAIAATATLVMQSLEYFGQPHSTTLKEVF